MHPIKNKLILIMALMATAIFPAVAYQTVERYQLKQQLKTKLFQLKREKQEVEVVKQQEKEYRQFVVKVTHFTEQLKQNNMGVGGWDRHQVKVDQIKMNVEQLDKVVGQARHGSHYYFIPERFEIRSVKYRSDQINLKEVLKFDKQGSLKGKVLVSLSGEFMVKK